MSYRLVTRSGNSIPSLLSGTVFDSLFKDFFSGNTSFDNYFEKNSFPYNVFNLYDENGQVKEARIEYCLAGYSKDEIKISFDSNELRLVIEANKSKKANDANEPSVKDGRYSGLVCHKNGISYKRIHQEFVLDDIVDEANITSQYVDGLLTVRIPYKTKDSSKQQVRLIEVK